MNATKTKAPARQPLGLAMILGSVSAAAMLFVTVPKHESGRTVEAKVVGEAVEVRHVRGPQYLQAYRDIAGIWTICDGITKGVRAGQTETPEGCRLRLEQELIVHAQGVMACTPRLREPGRDYQRAAAVSLAYNIGVAAYCRSTVDRRFDGGDWRGGCAAFPAWNKARVNGQLRPVAGLTARREEERKLCLKGLDR